MVGIRPLCSASGYQTRKAVRTPERDQVEEFKLFIFPKDMPWCNDDNGSVHQLTDQGNYLVMNMMEPMMAKIYCFIMVVLHLHVRGIER